ncbi:hypothetical protein BDY21DRAFT_362168 [Lineolata rhizophorae]|uniref:Uncharacterized protein n=1 Tax=Lineolata rhizophorae TaxID=578093 RepID=A0A6A6P6R7_9PEZI|nr:hypothetical protein BDY21DRAFT_362168 [Lineolata rhizophorae]
MLTRAEDVIPGQKARLRAHDENPISECRNVAWTFSGSQMPLARAGSTCVEADWAAGDPTLGVSHTRRGLAQPGRGRSAQPLAGPRLRAAEGPRQLARACHRRNPVPDNATPAGAKGTSAAGAWDAGRATRRGRRMQLRGAVVVGAALARVGTAGLSPEGARGHSDRPCPEAHKTGPDENNK